MLSLGRDLFDYRRHEHVAELYNFVSSYRLLNSCTFNEKSRLKDEGTAYFGNNAYGFFRNYGTIELELEIIAMANQLRHVGLFEAFATYVSFACLVSPAFQTVCPSVFFPGATNREAAWRGVTKNHATSTKTNHRRDIYFPLFRGNRATCFLFSN